MNIQSVVVLVAIVATIGVASLSWIEVDPNRISVLGHNEGTLYAPRVAIDNSTKVKNVILMANLAQNPTSIVE